MKEHFKGIRGKIESVLKKTEIIMKQDFEGLIKKLKLTKK